MNRVNDKVVAPYSGNKADNVVKRFSSNEKNYAPKTNVF
jgi:hypothetical protein